MPSQTLYDILEVEPSARPIDLKKAYHRLALRYHPDRNRGDERAVKKFQAVKSAYDYLSNTAQRHEYDRGLISRNANAHWNSGNNVMYSPTSYSDLPRNDKNSSMSRTWGPERVKKAEDKNADDMQGEHPICQNTVFPGCGTFDFDLPVKDEGQSWGDWVLERLNIRLEVSTYSG